MEHGGEVKFEIDDVVYNKRTNTIGIVRMEDERGETKTDADGNVNTSELEYYNPMNYPNQKDAKVAPSTAKEIDQRMLYQPFKPREMGGYMADGGQIKVGDTITATTGVKVKVVDYDPNFGGRVKVERLDEYATGKPSQWMPLKKFKFESGGYMADGGELHRTQEFAKGGAISHGLKMGDTIVADQFWENSVVVDNPKTGRAVVYLESGKRKESK